MLSDRRNYKEGSQYYVRALKEDPGNKQLQIMLRYACVQLKAEKGNGASFAA